MSENYKGKHVAGSGRRSVLLAAALAVIGLGAFVLWSLHPWDRGQELPAQSQRERIVGERGRLPGAAGGPDPQAGPL